MFEILQEGIQNWTGRSVTQLLIQTFPAFRGEVFYFLLSKVTDQDLNNRQEQIVVHLEVDASRNIAFIRVACEKPATACGVLTHIWELCEQRMVEAFGINLRALWCPECGAALSDIPRIGRKVVCSACGTSFIPEVLTR